MNPNLIDFVKKLTIKRNGNNQDSEDISQEVFINLLLEGIADIKGNELRINHLIHYHLNKINRINKKFKGIESAEQFDSLLEVETTTCDSLRLEKLFNEFRNTSDYKEEELDLFYRIKFQKVTYRDSGFADNATTRKKVNRIFVKFKHFLKKKGIKLDSFYEE